MGVPEKRWLKAGDVELEVLESGSGGRPLLVLHGFCGAKENYDEVIGPLARAGWHVVVPDQRGHGASSHPEGEGSYGFGYFVSDALALADTLGWDRFVLLGHSMGGMTAQMLALEHPERVAALILMDTAHARLEIDAELVDAGRQMVEAKGLAALVEAMSSVEDPLATEAHKRLVAERHGYQELLDAQTLACSAEMWVAMTRAMFGAEDRLDDLRTLAVPTLVVVGEQDRPFLGPSRRMAEAIPGARLEALAGAGHSPQLEAPEALLGALTGFLRNLR